MSTNRFAPPQQGQNTGREHYVALDGMRAYAAVGIVMMHELANIGIKPDANYLTLTVIPYFTNFVFLFMMISAFGVSCGYYERIKHGQITPSAFYLKRYKRVLPFFALMVLIDFLWEHNISSLAEGFADITLCFGLYPNADIHVIGVGWFIGLVFLFYMLYPFFVFLMDNKRRAWLTLAVSLILAVIGLSYFASDRFFEHPMAFTRNNIIYSGPFFVVGGIVFLYRHSVSEYVRRHSWQMLAVCCVVTIGAFVAMSRIHLYVPTLVMFSAWLVYALGSRDAVLNNAVVRYLSKISMEVYLCHMLFFRIIGLAHLEKFVSNANMLYVFTLLLTLAGAVAFSHVCKFYLIGRIKWLK